MYMKSPRTIKIRLYGLKKETLRLILVHINYVRHKRLIDCTLEKLKKISSFMVLIKNCYSINYSINIDSNEK